MMMANVRLIIRIWSMFLATVFLKLSTDACLTVTLATAGVSFSVAIDGGTEARIGRQQCAADARALAHQPVERLDVHVRVETGDVVDQRDDRHVDDRPLVLQHLDAQRVAGLHMQHVGQLARQHESVGRQLRLVAGFVDQVATAGCRLAEPMMPTRREWFFDRSRAAIERRGSTSNTPGIDDNS